MKIKNDIPLDTLLEYGFTKIVKDEDCDSCDDQVKYKFQYQYEIGHSRRGQHYYIFVKESNRELYLYASEPDGSGGPVEMTDILLDIAHILEKDKQYIGVTDEGLLLFDKFLREEPRQFTPDDYIIGFDPY
jgi:hypothetical protein